MTMREKLIELLWKYDQLRMMRMSIEDCADYLIAHGVTIQDREIDFDYAAEVE